ncbi:restriction endonuclease subunit S [Alistipes shahii]|uniref:restriction endonuclease subunit S n=1 Tax=Alistipes shahii TaxID=328814 RepID=UPI00243323E0|nr:restriction endonuclease subunit S [Alistipes shahii]MCI7592364.1 restriction endonuclease subunit S [Alistipes shahii]
MLNVYPTYKDSGIEWLGQIPTHWELTRISSVLTEVKDLNTSLRFSHPSQFKFGDIILKPDVNIEDVSSLSKCIIFRKDDILINGLNLNYDFVTQRIARANYTGIITSAYIAVRVRNNLSSKYVTYLFKALDSRKVFNGLGTGIRLTLTYKELKKYYILLPPQEEQRQIVAYLDYKSNKIDERICQRERELQTLSELKQAEIAAVVTRGLDPNVPMKESGIEWLGKIPAHWEVRKIKNCLQERSEKGYPNEPILCATQSRGVIPQDMYDNRVVVVNKDFDKLKLVKCGDFVISLRSFQGGIEYAYYQGIISAAYTILTPKDKRNSEYFKHLFKSHDFIQLLQTCVTGIREGQNINYAMLAKHFIPIPPIEEQQKIVLYIKNRLYVIDEYLSKLKAEINYLQEYKQRLISDVVTGKVDVRGVEIPNEE